MSHEFENKFTLYEMQWQVELVKETQEMDNRMKNQTKLMKNKSIFIMENKRKSKKLPEPDDVCVHAWANLRANRAIASSNAN